MFSQNNNYSPSNSFENQKISDDFQILGQNKAPRHSFPGSFLNKMKFLHFYTLVILSFVAISNGESVDSTNYYSIGSCRRCVDSFDPTTDYFSTKIDTDSTEWNVSYFNHYKVIENYKVTAPGSVKKIYAYLCGTPEPDIPNDDNETIALEIPVRNFALMSSTQIAFFEQIGQLETFVAYASKSEYIDNGLSCATALAEDGDVAFNEDGQGLSDWFLDLTSANGNISEKSLDAVFTDHYTNNNAFNTDGNNDFVPPENRDNAPVIEISIDTSKNAIDAAEWLGYISLFFNKEDVTKGLVNNAEDLYNCHVSNVNANQPKTKVLYLNSCPSYSDTYVMGKTGDYYQFLIEDAHGVFFDGKLINASYVPYSSSITKDEFETYFSDLANAQDVVIIPATRLYRGNCNFTLPALENAIVYAIEETEAQNLWFGGRLVVPDRTIREFISMTHPTQNDPKKVMFTQIRPDLNGSDYERNTPPPCVLSAGYDAQGLSLFCGDNFPLDPISFEDFTCDSDNGNIGSQMETSALFSLVALAIFKLLN